MASQDFLSFLSKNGIKVHDKDKIKVDDLEKVKDLAEKFYLLGDPKRVTTKEVFENENKVDMESGHSLEFLEKFYWSLEKIPLTKLKDQDGWTPQYRMWDEGDSSSRSKVFKDPNYISGDEAEARKYAKMKTKAPPILVVEQDSSGRYTILNGRHRVRAVFLNKEPSVLAYKGIKK